MVVRKESELHILGKSVFEDAEGKDIQLPAPPSPRFNPPVKDLFGYRAPGVEPIF